MVMVAVLLVLRSPFVEGFGFTMGSSRSFGFHEARLSRRTGNVLASAWSAHLASDQIRWAGAGA